MRQAHQDHESIALANLASWRLGRLTISDFCFTICCFRTRQGEMKMRTRIFHNPHVSPTLAGAPADRAPLEFHRRLPGYAPTPLVDAPGLAAALGVGRVWVKDESRRLGLPAFKILGASWAVYRAL